jgi:putative aldouronate transport system substrate-binding protein
MKKLVSCVLLLLVLAGGLVFAAGGSQAPSGAPAASATTTPLGQYPIATTAALRYWLVLHANQSANYTNMADTPFGIELLKRTGVKVTFEHPAGTAADAFNLMIASGDDMPDIIEYNWVTLVGGPAKAIDDGTIIRLNDVIDRYAPNLKATLRDNPEWDRMVKTDDGGYYVFPFIRGHEKLLYSQGLMISKDWLDELGLQPPQTIPEWHDVLVAFRDRKNIASPHTQVWGNRNRMFMPGFGILDGMFVSATDKRVRFGNIEAGYRRWIETMAQWYKEGLIDKDIASINTNQQNQKMTTGQAGSTVASVGSGMGTWTLAARPANAKYEIMALQYPVLNRGDRLVYSIPNQPFSGQDSPAISAKSKNVEIAARFLDYGYTAQGHNVYNFGTEGQSFEMRGGKPFYTANIMSGTDKKWPLAQAMGAWSRGPMAGPFVQDVGYIEQYYAEPEQAQALLNYILPGAVSYLLPAVTPTQAESREYATIMQEVNTYVSERTTRWLLGTEAVTDATWTDYVNTIRRMNIDRAIAIQNGALDRFNRR